MCAFEELIGRLNGSSRNDRRLDSEVVALALGPAGCVIDSIEGLDGWDIHFAPDGSGEAVCWREAADIAPVTAFLDAATDLVIEARPIEAAEIITRALRRLCAQGRRVGGEELVAHIARTVCIELLETIAHKVGQSVTQAA